MSVIDVPDGVPVINTPVTATPVRLGLIGAGIAAKELHWPALARLKDRFRVVAVSARRKENAEALAALAGGAHVTVRYADILERTDVEAVVITVPFAMNARVVRDSLAAGKHVLVEKPLAPSEVEARRLAALERKKRKVPLVTMAAENWRYRAILGPVSFPRGRQGGLLPVAIHDHEPVCTLEDPCR